MVLFGVVLVVTFALMFAVALVVTARGLVWGVIIIVRHCCGCVVISVALMAPQLPLLRCTGGERSAALPRAGGPGDAKGAGGEQGGLCGR